MNIRSIIPHLAAIAVISGCAWLAHWQVERAGEKREIIARWHDRAPMPLSTLEPPYSLPQPVSGVGIWDGSRQILLDNKIRDQRMGVHVLTPLVLPDGRLFLVNRGWAAWPSRSAQLPDPHLPDSPSEYGDPAALEAEIQGVLNTPPGTGIRLGETRIENGEAWPLLATYFDRHLLVERLGEALQPAVVQLDPRHPAHLTGEAWKVVTFGPDRHIGYALTWISIAVVVAAIWLVLTVRQIRARLH